MNLLAIPTQTAPPGQPQLDPEVVNRIKTLATSLSTSRYEIGDLALLTLKANPPPVNPDYVLSALSEAADIPPELLRQCVRVSTITPPSMRSQIPWSTALLFCRAGDDGTRLSNFLSRARADSLPPTYRRAQNYLGTRISSAPTADSIRRRLESDPELLAALALAPAPTYSPSPDPDSDETTPPPHRHPGYPQHPNAAKPLSPVTVVRDLRRVAGVLDTALNIFPPTTLSPADLATVRNRIDETISLLTCIRATLPPALVESKN